MGCSPSHTGIIQSIVKNTARPLRKQKAILPPGLVNNGFTIPLSGKNDSNVYDPDDEVNAEAVRQNESLQGNGQRAAPQDKKSSMIEDKLKKDSNAAIDEAMVKLSYERSDTERTHVRKQSSTGSEQELGNETQLESNPRKGKKSRRVHKQGRRSKSKEKPITFCETETKVDFPDLLVKSHQNAYAYLNPNLSKYEAIISMANQAAQTQLIMQQMISFMALRFDEINQCLEEIAEDGENLLKNVGNNLTWPLGKGDPTEQPDLLQQLLQYTVNKMQALNCTVASLTSSTLQETCSYLQSASTTLQEKLKVKQWHDERLLRTIKLLDVSAAGIPQSGPNDSTLYSEDSGIGGDSESIKEGRPPGRKGSMRSCGSGSLGGKQEMFPQREITSESKMADIASEQNYKAVFDATINTKESIEYSTKAKHNYSKRPIMTDSVSMNSLESSTTIGQDSINDQETEDTTGSEESSDEDENNGSVSDQISLPQRPMTSPAGTSAYKHPSKWLENPENEEMSLKMKEAISEKIKFVPGKTNNQVWVREEGVPSAPVRPSTASGCSRRTSKHRRSRSAESLRSQAEDPTLLELQRTQKELSKKLEQLYVSNGNKSTEMKTCINLKSFMHKKENITPSASTNKLKACLDKSFNILPSQERVTLKTFDQRLDSNPDDNNKSNDIGIHLKTKDVKRKENVASAERKLESLNVSPRQSVRKLIQTFSPGEDSIKSKEVKTLGPLRCIRKYGVPVLPPTLPSYRGLQPLNHKPSILSTNDEHSTNISTNLGKFASTFTSTVSPGIARTDTNEVVAEDFENFPPPPLEILMDDSFNVLQSADQGTHTELNIPGRTWQGINSESSIAKKITISQKIKGSINAIDLLPSKNATETYMSTSKSFRNLDRKYSSVVGQHLAAEEERGYELQMKQEIEQAAHLYRQSHKIIPLQNPGELIKSSNDEEIKELSADVPSLPKQKLNSTASQRKSEKSPALIKRISPTKATITCPPSEKRLTNPPVNNAVTRTQSRVQPSPPPLQTSASSTVSSKVSSPPALRKLPSPPSQRKQSSPPQVRRQQSPPSQRRLPSPPSSHREPNPPSHCTPSPPLSPSFSQRGHTLSSPPQVHRQQSPLNQRRLPSPPSSQRESSPSSHCTPSPPSSPSFSQKGHKLSSPPQLQRQQSPPNQRRLPSPPSNRREPSSPSHCTPSPPLSPSFSQKGLRRNSDEPLPSSKMIGNAQSIFCPSSTSLFEAKLPPSPPNTSGTEGARSQVLGPILRNTFPNRSYDNQQRRVAMCTISPQPFVRRCFSERRPRVQLRLPMAITASSTNEPDVQHSGTEELAPRENEQGANQCSAEPGGPGQTTSRPELCIVGQGFQKE